MTAEPASFEFDGTPPRRGVPVVNGHPVRTALSVDVHMDAESLPVVTLRLLAADAVKLALDDAAVIAVDDDTRAALTSLGWTPPGKRARAGQVLTASDPEPPAGTIVRDSCGGGEWYRSGEGDYWLKQKNDYADPETWTKVAGNYGPVTVLEWGDGDLPPTAG